jgi:hypothetical protein
MIDRIQQSAEDAGSFAANRRGKQALVIRKLSLDDFENLQ